MGDEEILKELFRAVIRDDATSLRRIQGESGIDLWSVKNSAQQTPLQLARERKRKEVLAFLQRPKPAPAKINLEAKAAVAPGSSQPTDAAESVEVFRAVMKDDATQASASVVVGGTAVRTRSADVVSTQRRTAGQAIFKDLTLGEHFRLSPSFPDRRVGLHEDAS
eukprot:s1232_g11.t1